MVFNMRWGCVVCGLVCSTSSGFSKGLLFSAGVFGIRFPFCVCVWYVCVCGVCVCVCVCGVCRAAALKTTTHPKLGAETICYNSTSNSPDDGRMYPKHVELRIHQ